MKYYKASVYGVAYSIDNHNKYSKFTSVKWLLSRWYVHGYASVVVSSILSKITSTLISKSSISLESTVGSPFRLLGLRLINLKRIQNLFYSRLYCFVSFR